MTGFQFDRFQLNASLVLSRGGEVLHVPPKELKLLCLLLEADGETVGQGLIEKSVWPRQTVSYASVTRCVYSLRKILGDHERKIVATVPRRGYRLGVTVRRANEGPAPSVTAKAAAARPEALAHFSEARRLARAGEFAALQKAAELLGQAIEADAEFAVAHAALADLRMYQSARGYIHPTEGWRLGLAHSEAALALDPELASAHAARGWFLCLAGEREDGFAALETALRLDPSHARTYSYLSFAQRAAGLVEESLRNARQACAIDPHSLLHRNALGWRLFCSNRAKEALEVARRNRLAHPSEGVSHGAFAVYASWLGHHDEALEALPRAIDSGGANPGLMTFQAYVEARSGDPKRARELAECIGGEGLPRAPRALLAVVYQELGEADIALELFREARDELCPWFGPVRFDPRIGSLARDPRFKALYEGRQRSLPTASPLARTRNSARKRQVPGSPGPE